MLDYEVTIDPDKGMIIRGDFVQGSIPVNIPDANLKKNSSFRCFLISLLQAIWRYLSYRIDKVGASIEEDYHGYTREELLKFGCPNIKFATTDDPQKSRS